MTDNIISAWFKQLGLEPVVIDSPPSYESATAVKNDNVIFLIRKNTHVVEIQYTNKFTDDIVTKFFKMNDSRKSRIEYELKHLLTIIGIRYRIITNLDKNFFGFSLMIYLPKKPSDTSIINNYTRILEIRDLVGHKLSLLMEDELKNDVEGN